MESSAEDEDPAQLCFSNSISRILRPEATLRRKQKFHVIEQLCVFLILSAALFAFSRSCSVPSHNGSLQELDEATTFNKSGTPRGHHAFAKSVNRKLLVDPERMGVTCTSEDIVILQGEMGPLPDGIPSFTVQIINLCVAGCPVSDIHVSCGWFASTKLINPGVFKRVNFNDCIVNDKLPLKWGDSIVFEYTNSFQYPLQISSLISCCW
ncbi:hypothetical protein L7F22_039531 [Adiantum nelumboides]|nr:hypothetical protein [Adiantum nelumboides]